MATCPGSLAPWRSVRGCGTSFRMVPRIGARSPRCDRLGRRLVAAGLAPLRGHREAVGECLSARNCLSAAVDSLIHCGILSLPRNSSTPLRVKSGTTLKFYRKAFGPQVVPSSPPVPSAASVVPLGARPGRHSGTKEEAARGGGGGATIAGAASQLPPWLGSCCGREGEQNNMI